MSVDSERKADLERTLRKGADEDPMLQAYGRYWLPQVERIAAALEKLGSNLDERAEERRILKETELEELRRMADSVEIAVGCMMQLIIGEQKERWIENHPRHTEAQLKEAMEFYDSVAIRGSGLKYDKK